MSEANAEHPPGPTPRLVPAPPPVAADSPVEAAPVRRRRGSRGGGRAKKAASSSAPAAPGSTTGPPEASSTASGSSDVRVAPVPRPRIGDTRPAPRPVPVRASSQPPGMTPVEAVSGGGDAEPSVPSGSGSGSGSSSSSRRRRRRGGRGRSGAKGAAIAVAGPTGSPEAPVELDQQTLERRRGRERKGRPVGRYLMCVQVRPEATQIAVLEGRSLISHFVSRPTDDSQQIHGNVYLGRVQNVLPGMEAAFVDIGTPKNAVLYAGDLQHGVSQLEGESATPNGNGDPGDKRNQPRIEEMLRPGQTVLCQVTKNPIGTKGARLTQEVSLAGRFVVLVPDSTTYGISKRLDDNERKRLRRILDDVRPEKHGLIVRTAAEGAAPEELRRDVQRLLDQWAHIERLAKRTPAPALLSREPPLPVRVIREEFSRDYRGVVIDDPELYRDVSEYVSALIPELADRIELYEETDLSLFERQHIHEQLYKALDRKVWLPSGGSLIIERTEALTVIDVNTGKNVGSSNLEETVFANNVEAADEIARQLRLRDIGGIIVIDFIDMEVRENREEVLRTLKDALARDKTRTQVFEISELGLVQMTRKRVSEGLVESFSATCPTCSGRGIVLDETLL